MACHWSALSARAQSDDSAEDQVPRFRERQQLLSDKKGILYFGPAEVIQKFLAVEKYQERWPLIPAAELHASSVRHPMHPECRWLHTVAACQFCRKPSVVNLEVRQDRVALSVVRSQFVPSKAHTSTTRFGKRYVGRPGAPSVSTAADLASRKDAVRSRTSPVPQSGAQ